MQSANQLKTPANVSWAFKVVSQFGSLGYIIMKIISEDCWPDSCPEDKHWKKEKVWKKKMHNQPRESQAYEDCQAKSKNLGELHKEWAETGVKASRATTHSRVKEFG